MQCIANMKPSSHEPMRNSLFSPTTDITKDSDRMFYIYFADLHAGISEKFTYEIYRHEKKASNMHTLYQSMHICHIACNQEQIDWRRKKWIASDHQHHQHHHHWAVEIKTDLGEKYFEMLIYFENWYIWCYCTRLVVYRYASTEAFANFLLASMFVCLFCLLVCACFFFTFYRYSLRNTKKANTVQLRYLHYSFGRSVGWLAGWCAVAIYFSFVHISFVFIIYFHKTKHFKIKAEREKEKKMQFT